MNESITLKDVFAISERARPAGEARGQSSGETSDRTKDRWTRIGIGFVNRDSSINVVLDAIPLNGRLQIRDRRPKDQQPYTAKKERP